MEHNIVLIYPESDYEPMGALYLANALAPFNINTHLIESCASREDLDALIGQTDPVLVGCSVMTGPEIGGFVRLSQHIKLAYKDLPVVWGGMHPTIVSEQTEKEPYIDLVVAGEGEITFPRIVRGLTEKNKLPDHKFITAYTPLRLDDFRPQWELIDIGEYLFPESHSVHSRVNFTHDHILYYYLTSRGCSFPCNFCYEVQRTQDMKVQTILEGDGVDRTWRAHSVEWIEQQLNYMDVRLGQEGKEYDGVGLWDDMIFGKSPEHRARAKTIFNIMRERKKGYLVECRANALKKIDNFWNDRGEKREADLYKFLKETGCMQVFVGTESADQATLREIQKGTKVEDYERLIEISHDIGLPLRCSFIVGFPEETDASVNATLDMIERLKEEPFVSVSGPKWYTPYPGVPQFKKAVARGLMVPKDTLGWANLTRYGDYEAICPWITEHYSKATLRRIDSFIEEIAAEKKKKWKVDSDSDTLLELAEQKEKILVDLVRRH